MATGITNSLLLLSILLPLISISAVAGRPCKTIFFISTTTTSSYYPSNQNPLFQNPNTNPHYYRTFFITEVHRVYQPINNVVVPTKPDQPAFHPLNDMYSSITSSIRDSTMDIMSIVGALLFGVGCGALTAGTMYLIWSLFSPRRFEFGDSDDEFDHDFDDSITPKKMGYVAIPAPTVVVTPPKEV